MCLFPPFSTFFPIWSPHPRPWLERQEQQRDRPPRRETDRHHLTSQRADTQTDRQKHRQGPPYSTNIRSWCRAKEHNMENVFITPSSAQNASRDSGENFPLRPLEHFLLSQTHTSRLNLTWLLWVCERACVCVRECVFLCIEMELVWKGLSHYSFEWVPLTLGVARSPFAPSGLLSNLKTRHISLDRKHLGTKT